MYTELSYLDTTEFIPLMNVYQPNEPCSVTA